MLFGCQLNPVALGKKLRERNAKPLADAFQRWNGWRRVSTENIGNGGLGKSGFQRRARYSLHCRSAINSRMRSFAFIKIIHSSTKHCIVQLRCKIVGLCIDNITQMRYTIWKKNAVMGYKGATGRERKTILLRLLSENGHGQRRTF